MNDSLQRLLASHRERPIKLDMTPTRVQVKRDPIFYRHDDGERVGYRQGEEFVAPRHVADRLSFEDRVNIVVTPAAA